MNIPKYIAEFPKKIGILDIGKFVVERRHAGILFNKFLEVELEPLPKKSYRPLKEHGAKKKTTILFVRPGGYGDLLFLTPTLRALKIQCPDCIIKVSCSGRFAPALLHNPDVDWIVPYPVPVAEWESADRHVWLERILEDREDAGRVNAIDLIADVAGVEVSDKTMRFELLETERTAALECYPKTDKPRVGIQVEASAVNRTYPGELLVKVASKLVESGCEVFLFGVGDHIEAGPEFVNLAKINPTFRQSCAILSTCDAVLAPDSSLCHVAGALNIPTLGLFGPFQSALRTKYAPSITAIDGNATCAPCHHHAADGEDWPEGCPGKEKGRCWALANIDPKRIVTTIHKLLSGRDPKPPENLIILP